MSHIFVYGSLLADEVVELLLQRVPKTQPAVIKGYQRYRIKRRIYPATIKSAEDHSVEGRVFLDLTANEVEILDDFEDEDYFRDTVTAELQDGSKIDAAVYLWQDKLRNLLHSEWNYDYFREHNLTNFLDMMRQWETSGDFPENPPDEIA